MIASAASIVSGRCARVIVLIRKQTMGASIGRRSDCLIKHRAEIIVPQVDCTCRSRVNLANVTDVKVNVEHNTLAFCFCQFRDRPSHYHKLGNHESEHSRSDLYMHDIKLNLYISRTLCWTFVLDTLSVRLGHTLQLVLLLDRIAVAASLGGVDELFG